MTSRSKPQRPWTAEEDARLRALYDTMPASQVARALGRTKSSIKNRINKLGLAKGSNPGRFPRGSTSWNTGLHYVAGGRSAETRFKKGSRPHTWHPIGHERVVDGYLQRKVTDTGYTPGDYRPVHHLVWQEAGREIPAGHALLFRDGNRRNFALDNLELISRADLMRRNTRHNLPPELNEVIGLRAALVRKLNNRSKKHEQQDHR